MSQTVASPQTKTPIKVNKIGHLVYEVSDLEASTKFWTEILGFTVSDTNQWGMVFLRCNDDHHSIALVPSAAREPVTAQVLSAFAAAGYTEPTIFAVHAADGARRL